MLALPNFQSRFIAPGLSSSRHFGLRQLAAIDADIPVPAFGQPLRIELHLHARPGADEEPPHDLVLARDAAQDLLDLILEPLEDRIEIVVVVARKLGRLCVSGQKSTVGRSPGTARRKPGTDARRPRTSGSTGPQ